MHCRVGNVYIFQSYIYLHSYISVRHFIVYTLSCCLIVARYLLFSSSASVSPCNYKYLLATHKFYNFLITTSSENSQVA